MSCTLGSKLKYKGASLVGVLQSYTLISVFCWTKSNNQSNDRKSDIFSNSSMTSKGKIFPAQVLQRIIFEKYITLEFDDDLFYQTLNLFFPTFGIKLWLKFNEVASGTISRISSAQEDDNERLLVASWP